MHRLPCSSDTIT
ncbi:hypothetical protein E2C01_095071 [Portunus trituberculatus]|uniref:Uncharacterized protein n=1 Tax=Portunus trituberculatus TaxID=210409 RepID=A0A5B7K4T9_PORTR|nr:hypothetical protein [Portunus trituberculatus]